MDINEVSYFIQNNYDMCDILYVLRKTSVIFVIIKIDVKYTHYQFIIFTHNTHEIMHTYTCNSLKYIYGYSYSNKVCFYYYITVKNDFKTNLENIVLQKIR